MRRQRRGSDAIEFALVLPVILLILSGLIDYGVFLQERSAMVSAVRSGARVGAMTDFTNGPEAEAIAVATNAFTQSGTRGTPVFTAVVSGTVPDQTILVDGTMPFEPMFNLFAAVPATVEFDLVIRMADQAPVVP